MTQASLYRKHRPSSWGELSGQKTAVRMLKNAVARDAFSHAWIFSGPRGTGKTTCAKIVAKALNCQSLREGDPCGDCAACRAFQNGSYADYIELDAASHRGINEFRRIGEMALTAPVMGREHKKVFVIDEAHMLTPEAANAFLKTLEEPPPWVVFILATTEPERLLPTILSRCIQVQFQLLSPGDVITRLRQVCEIEHLHIEDAALQRIAERGEGGLRDTLTLLEQAWHLCGDRITFADWQDLMGEADLEVVDSILKARLQEDRSALLKLIREQIFHGLQPDDLLVQLIERLREFLVVLLKVSPPRMPVPDWVLQQSQHKVQAVLSQFLGVQEKLAFSPHRVAALEAGLLTFGGSVGQGGSSDSDVESLRRRTQKLEDSIRRIRRFLKDVMDGAPKASEPVEAPTVQDAGLNHLPRNQKLFEMLRREMKRQDPLAYALIDPAVVDDQNDKLRIYWPSSHSFHHKRIQEERPWKALKALIDRFFGENQEVELILGDLPAGVSTSSPSVSEQSTAGIKGKLKPSDSKEGASYVSEELKQRLMKDPGLSRLIQELQASIENVL